MVIQFTSDVCKVHSPSIHSSVYIILLLFSCSLSIYIHFSFFGLFLANGRIIFDFALSIPIWMVVLERWNSVWLWFRMNILLSSHWDSVLAVAEPSFMLPHWKFLLCNVSISLNVGWGYRNYIVWDEWRSCAKLYNDSLHKVPFILRQSLALLWYVRTLHLRIIYQMRGVIKIQLHIV
jgi:hypothetical protein